MNKTSLISLVSQNTDLPPPKVAKVTEAFFEQLAEIIENQGQLASARLKITGFVVPAKLSDAGVLERPQLNAARIRTLRNPANKEALAAT